MLKYPNYIESPCLRLCNLENDICTGCFRSIQEIREWPTVDKSKKLQILNNCGNRKHARINGS